MNTLNNKVQLIGRLGGTPEIKTTSAGKKMARLSLATNTLYRNAKGEKIKETQWHNLVAWGRIAEIAEEYLDKGNEVAVEGKLVNRSYEDQAGLKRSITEVIVNEFLMLGSRKREEEGVVEAAPKTTTRKK